MQISPLKRRGCDEGVIGFVAYSPLERGFLSGQIRSVDDLGENDVVPIPGTKKIKYLEENITALDIELTVEELQLIDEAAPKGATAGQRYLNMSTVNL